ncbi:LysR substrate-binding domain-containing protein [Cupriavidus sp. H39]|uniref:LysR substrate-binding domain-containing protein n=1 Tax=Cupriavidus sp. H39 TaxID=3401635 RepID=UPI003D071C24
MKLHHLHALTAIAQHGSINAAARALCLSQPAITKTMRELESEIGVPLLNRNSWGVTVTEEGRLLLERARVIVHEFERAEREMAVIRGRRASSLRIGISPLAGLTVLPEAFVNFRLARPDVAVDLLQQDAMALLDGLRTGYLDFALAGFSEVPSDPFILSKALASYPGVFAIRRGSPLARSTSCAQLQDAEWLHADAGDAYPRYLEALFARHGLPPPKRVTRCTSRVLIDALMSHMDAVMPLSHITVQKRSLIADVQAMALPEDPPSLNLCLMTRDGSIQSDSATYFIRCIHEAMAE